MEDRSDRGERGRQTEDDRERVVGQRGRETWADRGKGDNKKRDNREGRGSGRSEGEIEERSDMKGERRDRSSRR